MNPHMFVSVSLGGDVYKLRMTPEYRWRICTLENPKWASDFGSRGYLPLACQLWAMLDGNTPKIKGPKDVLELITDANAEELFAAMMQVHELSKPKAGSKNENGSTPAPSPASSLESANGST